MKRLEYVFRCIPESLEEGQSVGLSVNFSWNLIKTTFSNQSKLGSQSEHLKNRAIISSIMSWHYGPCFEKTLKIRNSRLDRGKTDLGWAEQRTTIQWELSIRSLLDWPTVSSVSLGRRHSLQYYLSLFALSSYHPAGSTRGNLAGMRGMNNRAFNGGNGNGFANGNGNGGKYFDYKPRVK